ncbi:MAG: signal peptidase II [Lachnospiraceae bacterium]|nr:signal peptidase II [Candidatus Equihabitans merdae]
MKSLLIGSGAFLADYVGKRLAEKHLDNKRETRSYLHDRVSFQLVKNKGMAGGGHADDPKLVTGVSLAGVVCMAAMAAYESAQRDKVSSLSKAGTALMLGGGAGNLLDRLTKHEVTDFICFKHLNGKPGKYVYNIADLALFAGATLCLLGSLKEK